MPSIELLLDPAADAALRAEWETLAAAGLPSQARHTGASNRPHITLAYAESAVPAPVVTGLPVPVTVASPVLFGSARRGFLLARLVRPSDALLAVHRAVHEVLGDSEAVDPLTRPGAWTPHVTLARRLTGEQLVDALALLDVRRAVEGTADEARMWDKTTRTITPLRSTDP